MLKTKPAPKTAPETAAAPASANGNIFKNIQNKGVYMKPITDLRKAEMKESFVGKKLVLREVRNGIKTDFGMQTVYTVTVDGGKELHDFFGGKGIDQQDMQVGDTFTIKTMDTGKGNPMYIAEEWSEVVNKKK